MFYQASPELEETLSLRSKAAHAAQIVSPEKWPHTNSVKESNESQSGTATVITNAVWNIFYILVFFSLQVNGVCMLTQPTAVMVVSGVVTFAAGTSMQLLEVIQPPVIIHWMPCWESTLGRGLVICFVSTLALHGVLILGLITWTLSVAVICAPLITGTAAAPPPLIKYDSIFPNHAAAPLLDAKNTANIISATKNSSGNNSSYGGGSGDIEFPQLEQKKLKLAGRKKFPCEP